MGVAVGADKAGDRDVIAADLMDDTGAAKAAITERLAPKAIACLSMNVSCCFQFCR
jgi:hypothetical protein